MGDALYIPALKVRGFPRILIIIEFGDSGYVALYRYESTNDTVILLACRHQKEAGY